MAADRRPYSAEDQDSFSYIDDMEQSEEPVVDAILEAEDYRAADNYGTTPAEERRGVPLEEQLAAEQPDTPGAVPDEWPQGPDPRSGELHDRDGQYAEEAGGEPADLGEIHVTEDDRVRAETLRETWEAGPPEDAQDDAALDEDRGQQPGPDDWR
ncbi:hypothetical protein K3N28_13230 [Glycomyces sp. TRM65418]|uniref:hypothetical protein n=1 Tax=Glycomyces sp. TRM65418 TaxID=2867006 RepID=UPI001CE5DAB6|nr:hypothetical protein [Glycomyces sp. TRM65418]MCC3764027.1 hypothetical protein [Glycomyces sp. TRM65418]QZD53718.1 hypothetical protein K3N28_13165 [Glycomyces sp. TRM65418]